MAKKIVEILLLILIILIGNNARSASYATVPQPGENSDEYAYAWAGLTLLTQGKPEAWTHFPDAYKNAKKEKVNVDHIFEKNPDFPEFTIVSPWFDNPPATGLITGGYAYLKGFRSLEEVSVITIRRPMLGIAILTTALLYVFASLVFNKKTGMLAAFLYSIIPSIVISSRLALAENFMAPLFLLTAIFALLYLKSRDNKYWILACLIGSFSILFKISAVAIPLALFLIALKYGRNEKPNLLKRLFLSFSFAFIVYLLYGLVLGFDEFVQLAVQQSQRFYGASSEAFYQAFTQAKITKTLTDGWLNMAWVSALIVSFKHFRKNRFRFINIIFIFSYLVVFLIFGSEAYGHYRIPFYPFLILSAAYVLMDVFQRPNIFLFLTLMLLPFGTTLHRLIGVMEFQKYVSLFRYGILCAFFTYMLFLVRPKIGVWFVRLFMIMIFILTVYLSIKEIYFFNIDKWYFAT